jgi:hypothetical protein
VDSRLENKKIEEGLFGKWKGTIEGREDGQERIMGVNMNKVQHNLYKNVIMKPVILYNQYVLLK